jgi:hypothetical protein
MRHGSKIGSVGVVLLVIGAFWAQAFAQEAELIVLNAAHGAKRLKISNSTGFFSITSGTFQNLTSTTVEIPPGPHQFRIVARFSGESNCQGVNGTWCSLRILVDGVEMNPVVGNDFAFDSPGDNWSGKAIERTSNILPAGTRTVTLQGALFLANQWFLDDWQLTLEIWRV